MSTDIPHIIHQTWKDANIPPQFGKFVQGWKTMHSSWEYRLWTDDDNLKLITINYPHLLTLYNSFDNGVKRADVARYCILHTYGGVYVDLDFECIKPIDKLIENKLFVIGTEPTFHAKRIRKYPFWLCNAFIASVPHHVVFDYILDFIKDRVKDHTRNAVCVTGPDVIQNVFLQRQHLMNDPTIYVCKPQVLYPLIDTHNKGMFESDEERLKYEHIQQTIIKTKQYSVETYAIHHWAGTWWGKDQAFLFDR
jgi:mannosyltransferase OCH1-like enzyme